MSFGNILGGALQGIGAGITAIGQQQAKAREDDVLMRRQMALENLRAQNDRDLQVTKTADAATAAQTAHTNRMEESRVEYDYRDRNDARSTARNTSSKITVDKAQTANQVALKKLESSLNMSEAQQKAALDLSNDLTKAGVEVGDYKIGTDGTLYALSKTGHILGKSPRPGMFTPDGVRSSNADSNPYGGTSSTTTATAAATKSVPAPKPAPLAKPAAPPKLNGPIIGSWDKEGRPLR